MSPTYNPLHVTYSRTKKHYSIAGIRNIRGGRRLWRTSTGHISVVRTNSWSVYTHDAVRRSVAGSQPLCRRRSRTSQRQVGQLRHTNNRSLNYRRRFHDRRNSRPRHRVRPCLFKPPIITIPTSRPVTKRNHDFFDYTITEQHDVMSSALHSLTNMAICYRNELTNLVSRLLQYTSIAYTYIATTAVWAWGSSTHSPSTFISCAHAAYTTMVILFTNMLVNPNINITENCKSSA